MMIIFNGLGHINIVVDNIDDATDFYCDVFEAKKLQDLPRFRNIGFAKSAGFMDQPEAVNVSIRFLKIPGANIHLELFQYHHPIGDQSISFAKTNDLGGPRHICLRVNNIDEAFGKVKNHPDITLINPSPDYKPFCIDKISPEEFKFFDTDLEANVEEKNKVCDIIGKIRYFYFIDKYGVQWEFVQGHDDIGQE